jgi:hypothetical protein
VVNDLSIAGVHRSLRGRLFVTWKRCGQRLGVSEAHQHLFKLM